MITNLDMRPLVKGLDSCEGMYFDPWEDVDVRDGVFAATGTSQPVAILGQANLQHTIETLRLFEVTYGPAFLNLDRTQCS